MNKPPMWFHVVSVLALLWNLMGCLAFAGDLMLTPQDVATLPEAQRALYAARPGWAVIATGVAVIGGALGCIALLLRRRVAFVLFVLSLLGLVAQDIGLFVLADGAALGGTVVVVLQALVLLIAMLLVWLARHATARGWLR